MKVVIQRVSTASVTVDSQVTGEIKAGLLILLGIAHNDTKEDVDSLIDKIINLRIFEDVDGKMNRSLIDINGEILLISQFTLYADSKKGRRPSFTNAAKPDIAVPLYEFFIDSLKTQQITVKTGIFGADMNVNLCNNGPVTIILETQNGKILS